MELILLRHPPVQARPGTCYGQLDVPAREPLEPGPEAVLATLAAWGAIDHACSSPLQRARRLAEPLAQALGLPLHADARWMELHFGAWEGRPWDAIPRTESDPWAADLEHRAPPGGETLAALRGRVHAAMDALADSGAVRALVVAHAGPIRVALARSRGVPAARAFDTALPFGSARRLRAQRVGAGWHWEEAP